MSQGYGTFQQKIIRDSGLDQESPDTILEMKTILADYREWKGKTASKK